MASPSRYRWNERAGRYVDAGGRFVSRATVRRELDRALANAQRRITELSERLRTNGISLDRWQVDMRRAIKQVHLYSAAAARGGWAQMTRADYLGVEQVLREQYRYLNGFASEIADGLPLDGRFLRRVALYAGAARRMYHAAHQDEMESRNFTEERSVRHPGDSCNGCIAAEAKGWQPIGTLVPIGERDCLGGCRCDMEYR